MNRFFTLLLAASCLTAVGQVTYPYNPDGNADGDIAVGDLQDFLVTYGNPFSPSEIMVGDSSLTYWVEQLSQTIQDQESLINALQIPTTRSLSFPDGYGGEFVSFSLTESDYTVPDGKNLFLTNQFVSEDLIPVITVDNVPVFAVDGGPSVSWFGQGNSYAVGSGSTLSYVDIVNASPQINMSGVLVDKSVEVVIIDLLTEEFIVPQGTNAHLVASYTEGFTPYPKVSIDSIPFFRVQGSGYMPSNLLGSHVFATSGQTIRGFDTDNSELLTLTCYLAPVDYFDTPLQDPSDEDPAEDNLGPCQGEFTVNYHGYDYELVEIGEQCWFAENLKTELYRNGEVITFGDENSWPSDSQGRQVIYGQRENYNCTGWYWPSEALSFSADACDSEAVLEAFGRLYNWPVVNDSRQICPSGYTVPTDEDWFDLEIHLGLGFQVANVFGDRRFYNEGLKLKSSLGWWASDEAAGNDLVGFAAQPAGEASGNGAVVYSNAGQWGLWWTSSPNGDSGGTLMATARAVRSNFKGISRFVAPRTNGYSIRCIKD